MAIRNWIINIDGAPTDKTPLRVASYPAPGAGSAYQDAVVKAFFSKPVRGVDGRSFFLTDSHGAQVPAWVDQIGDGTWGLFPNPVFLKGGESYTAKLKAGICDLSGGNCIAQDIAWKFTISKEPGKASGNTTIPVGFGLPEQHPGQPLPSTPVRSAHNQSRSNMRLAKK
jgi:hypothetical protein